MIRTAPLGYGAERLSEKGQIAAKTCGKPVEDPIQRKTLTKCRFAVSLFLEAFCTRVSPESAHFPRASLWGFVNNKEPYGGSVKA